MFNEFYNRAGNVWRNFIIGDGIAIVVQPKNLHNEIQTDIERIIGIIKSGLLCTATVSSDKSLLTPEELERIRLMNFDNIDYQDHLKILAKIKTGATNYFIVCDPAYGTVCKKCGGSSYIALIMDEDHLNLQGKAFVPSQESYLIKGVLPGSEDFVRMFPVPVNPKTDYWYCPTCKELHKFNYDEEIGFTYNMEVIQP